MAETPAQTNNKTTANTLDMMALRGAYDTARNLRTSGLYWYGDFLTAELPLLKAKVNELMEDAVDEKGQPLEDVLVRLDQDLTQEVKATPIDAETGEMNWGPEPLNLERYKTNTNPLQADNADLPFLVQMANAIFATNPPFAVRIIHTSNVMASRINVSYPGNLHGPVTIATLDPGFALLIYNKAIKERKEAHATCHQLGVSTYRYAERKTDAKGKIVQPPLKLQLMFMDGLYSPHYFKVTPTPEDGPRNTCFIFYHFASRMEEPAIKEHMKVNPLLEFTRSNNALAVDDFLAPEPHKDLASALKEANKADLRNVRDEDFEMEEEDESSSSGSDDSSSDDEEEEQRKRKKRKSTKSKSKKKDKEKKKKKKSSKRKSPSSGDESSSSSSDDEDEKPKKKEKEKEKEVEKEKPVKVKSKPKSEEDEKPKPKPKPKTEGPEKKKKKMATVTPPLKKEEEKKAKPKKAAPVKEKEAKKPVAPVKEKEEKKEKEKPKEKEVPKIPKKVVAPEEKKPVYSLFATNGDHLATIPLEKQLPVTKPPSISKATAAAAAAQDTRGTDDGEWVRVLSVKTTLNAGQVEDVRQDACDLMSKLGFNTDHFSEVELLEKNFSLVSVAKLALQFGVYPPRSDAPVTDKTNHKSIRYIYMRAPMDSIGYHAMQAFDQALTEKNYLKWSKGMDQ